MKAAEELHLAHKRVAELDVVCSWSFRGWLITVVPSLILSCAVSTWFIAVMILLVVPVFMLASKHSKACAALPEIKGPEEIRSLEAEVLRPISKATELGEREAVREVGPAWVPTLWQEDQDAFLEACPQGKGLGITLDYLCQPTPKGHAVVSCPDCEVTEIFSLGKKEPIKRVVDPCECHTDRVRAESALPMSPYDYL